MADEIDRGDYAPGWDEIPDQESSFDLRNNAEARKPWVVLLEFFRNGKNAIGTGFFINLPGSQTDVILTAGHNLLGSTNMRAWIIEHGRGPVETQISPDQFRICPKYEQTPDSTIDDYGAILLPGEGRPGFGFNIRFAAQGLGEKGLAWSNLLKKVVPVNNSRLPIHITGYSSKSVGNPFDGEGIVITKGNTRLRPDQVEYTMGTAEGVSGSSVWVADRGGESVVAIHNNGPRSTGRGSRGTRLNEKVLRQIFEWAGVGHMSKAHKVRHPKADAKGGLYLQFRLDDKEAWLGVGPDSPQTKFDVLPAYARPGKQDLDLALYTFCRSSNNSDNARWVVWKWNEGKAVLSDTFTNKAMVSLRWLPTKDSFKIVLERETTKEEKKKKKLPQSTVFVELTVDDSMISKADVPPATQDFLEFKPYKSTKEVEYNIFYLE